MRPLVPHHLRAVAPKPIIGLVQRICYLSVQQTFVQIAAKVRNPPFLPKCAWRSIGHKGLELAPTAKSTGCAKSLRRIMPCKPLVLGLKGRVRLSHLTPRDVVVVVCPICHRRWLVAPHVLYNRCHEYQLIDVIAKDFKCRRCNHGDRMCWHLERATGPDFPRAA